MRTILSPQTFVTAALLVAAYPSTYARACSAPFCQAASFAIPADSVVPANFGQLTVGLEKELFGRPDYTVRLFSASQPTQPLLSVEVKPGDYVSLASALQPGNGYVIEAAPPCPGESTSESVRRVAFSVSAEESEPPTSLGPLTLLRAGPGTVPIGGSGTCYDNYEASIADLELSPQHVAEPWRNLLTNYQLIVDGTPFDWRLTIGTLQFSPRDTARGSYVHAPGVFRTFTQCAGEGDAGAPARPDVGIAPGKHEVWVQARVPTRVPTVIESDHLEIDLRCAESVGELADGGQVADEADGGTASTTGSDAAADPEAAREEQDRRPSGDGSESGGATSTTDAPEHGEDTGANPDSGCSVAPGAASASRVPGLFLALLAMMVVRTPRSRPRA